MRKFFFIAVFFLAIIIVMFSFSELKNIAHTLERHDLRFLWIAVIVQVLWMTNDAFEYRALYKLIGLKERFRQLFLLASTAAFVNVVAPSGGWGGTAVFIDNAGKRGHPRGHMAAATALYLFFDYTAFLFLLGWGLLALTRRNSLNKGEITASIIMVLTVVGLGLLIFIGSKSAYQLGIILAWLGERVNRILWPFIHRQYFHEERAILFAEEVAEGLAVARQNHQHLLLPMGHAMINKSLMVIIMALTFMEFHVDATMNMLIAGYAIGYLFLVISPTPSGIGIVEGILPLALSGQGIAWEDAIVVTLTYRAVTFWVPLLLGGISFRILEKQNG